MGGAAGFGVLVPSAFGSCVTAVRRAHEISALGCVAAVRLLEVSARAAAMRGIRNSSALGPSYARTFLQCCPLRTSAYFIHPSPADLLLSLQQLRKLARAASVAWSHNSSLF